jgi:predicted negative regulator of RcsB-dependent stress response
VDGYRTDDEQMEAIREWWAENGRSVVFGVVLGLGAIFGWRAWQAHQVERGEAAAALFEQMTIASRTGEDGKVREAGEQLAASYDDTPYAVFARLLQARLAAEGNDLPAAGEHLEWALEHNDVPALDREIRLRLARIRLALKDYDGALSLLTAVKEPGGYEAAWHELRGDIEAARGNEEAARSAYEQALAARPPNDAVDAQPLELKLEALGWRSGS